MGAIDPGALTLDVWPMDSPLWVLDGFGDPMITSGYSILVELQAYNLTTFVVDTLRFGTDGYNDPTAPGYFSPRMIQSLNFRRDLFSGNTTGGPSRVSYGEMRLANDDGGLDTLRTTYAFAGWPATLRIGDPSLTYDTFEVLMSGKPQQVFFNFADLSVTLRDRLQDFNKPMQETKYLGNNVLPNGLEGGELLKDKPKPLLFGRVQNITPVLVNVAKLAYQVNDGPVEYLPTVYDRGVALTRGADYTSSADMMANQPGTGTFRCWMAGGYFRIGATPTGSITCDCADKWIIGATEVDLGNTAAQVAYRIIDRSPDVSMSDVNAGDMTALDLKNNATVGVWVADESTFTSALDAVLGSVGAWYGFDRFDKVRMQRHEAPTGVTGVCVFKMFSPSVDAALIDFDILDCRFLPTSDPDRGIPIYEVQLDYGRNYTIQTRDDLAISGITLDRIQFLVVQYRTAKSTNSTLRNSWPLATTKKVTTQLISQTAAQIEADRILSIYQAPHDFVEIDTPLTSELVATVDIGVQVVLQIPRFNYQNGKAMKVIGMQYSPGVRGCTLMLWG